MIEHDQEQHHDERLPPLLVAMLNEHDRIFDAETKRLLGQADRVIEILRLRAKGTLNRGRPKGQKAAA